MFVWTKMALRMLLDTFPLGDYEFFLHKNDVDLGTLLAFTDDSELELFQHYNFNEALVHLYKNDYTPTSDTLLADLDECDFAGHGEASLAGLGIRYTDPNGHARVDFDVMQWVRNSADPPDNDVYGWFLTNEFSYPGGPAPVLWGAELLTPTGFAMVPGGDPYIVYPSFYLNTGEGQGEPLMIDDLVMADYDGYAQIPCTAWSGAFINGVGHAQRDHHVVAFQHGGGAGSNTIYGWGIRDAGLDGRLICGKRFPVPIVMQAGSPPILIQASVYLKNA